MRVFEFVYLFLLFLIFYLVGEDVFARVRISFLLFSFWFGFSHTNTHTPMHTLCRLVHIALVLVHALRTQAFIQHTNEFDLSLPLSLRVCLCVHTLNHAIFHSVSFDFLCKFTGARSYTHTLTLTYTWIVCIVHFYYKWSRWFSNFFYAN